MSGMRIVLGTIVCWGLAALPIFPQDSENRIKAYLRKDEIYFFCSMRGKEKLSWLRLEQGKMVAGPSLCDRGANASVRTWGIAHERLWVINSSKSFNATETYLLSYGLSGLKQGHLIMGLDGDPSDPTFSFPTVFSTSPIDTYTFLAGMVEFEPRINLGIVPLSESEVRVFLGTNVFGRLIPEKNNAAGNLGLSVIDLKPRDSRIPHWWMGSYRYKAKWKKETGWQGDWRREEVFVPPFKESFDVFGEENATYFVTQSGDVFYSTKEHGKRSFERIWSKQRGTIRGILSDLERKRVYLLGYVSKQGKDVAYSFCLDPRVGHTFQELPESVFKPGTGAESLLQQFAKVLSLETREKNK